MIYWLIVVSNVSDRKMIYIVYDLFFPRFKIVLIQWIPDIWMHSKSFFYNVLYTYLRSNAAKNVSIAFIFQGY